MADNWNKAKRLLGYLKPYWKLEAATFLTMMVLSALMIALPGAIRYMIDDLIPGMVAQPSDKIDMTPVIYFGLFLIGIYLAQVLFSWIRDYLVGYVGANIIANMRSRLFIHLERQSLAFYIKHEIGEMMSRVLSDIQNVQNLLTVTLLMFFTNILMLAAIMTYLLTIDWKLTIIALIPVPITILMVKKFGMRLHLINRRLQETIAGLSAKLQESFLGIKTVKAFGQENRERENVDRIMTGLTDLYIKNSVYSSIAANVVQFVNMVGPIAVLAWGTYLVAAGEMQIGALIAFFMLLTYLYSPIRGLASTHIDIKKAMASVDRVFEYLDMDNTVIEFPGAVSIDRPSGDIKIEQVSFGYDESRFILEEINLHIKPKEKLAIVGPSGSGKTTLINLILRFYDLAKGQIMLDGIDLKKLSLKSLRDNIALVDQEPLLFRTSIFHNIAYSKTDAAPEEVISAARAANIHDFIENLPNKYDSQIGERGVNISVGEKQRICLARALLKDPAVIILDEATSALDSNSEQLIQKALEQVLVDKTAIIIAHRLSTIQHADRIIAIDKGRIQDQGTHQELLEKSTLYRELAQKQFNL